MRSLRGIGDNLSLLVCDGFDPADVPAGQHASWQASPVATINSGKSQSQESLERDLPSNERAYDDIRREIKRQVGERKLLFLIFSVVIMNTWILLRAFKTEKRGNCKRGVISESE